MWKNGHKYQTYQRCALKASQLHYLYDKQKGKLNPTFKFFKERAACAEGRLFSFRVWKSVCLTSTLQMTTEDTALPVKSPDKRDSL